MKPKTVELRWKNGKKQWRAFDELIPVFQVPQLYASGNPLSYEDTISFNAHAEVLTINTFLLETEYEDHQDKWETTVRHFYRQVDP